MDHFNSLDTGLCPQFHPSLIGSMRLQTMQRERRDRSKVKHVAWLAKIEASVQLAANES